MTHTQAKDKVDTTGSEYEAMAEKWELLHALLGGTQQMRAEKEKWLAREPRESAEAYTNRLSRSFLYNAYGDTVDKLVSKPFSRPVVCQGTMTDRIDEIKDDMDMNGRDLTQFARDVFTAGVIYGCTHILIDFPQFSTTATLADERASGVRPVFIHVKPTQVIGWRTETATSGEDVLTQVRILETKVEPNGEYGDTEIEYIRVYTRVDWQLWRRNRENDEDEFQLIDEGTHSFGSIPLVTYYISRTGILTATPPLEDLAWMNLAHWQSMSDQRNILRFARVGLLFAAGFSDEEMEEGLTIGPNQLIRSTNESAKVTYVEHGGHAIDSGQQDLDKLEERMKVLGLQPITQRSGNQTATGRALDESRTHTAIQAWIRSLENTLLQAFEYASKWINLDLPEDFYIDINNDFGLSERAIADIKSLIEMRKTAQISAETFLREIKRRGLLSEAVDIDEELLAIEEEGPMLSSMSATEEEYDEQEEEEESMKDSEYAVE